jgi:hypothetical protein
VNETQRKRCEDCEDAGIPAEDIIRIDDAVSLFNDPDLRDHVTNTLIEAWQQSQ